MESLAQKYPKYYKAVPEGVPPDEVDTYVINMMFPVDDHSGAILHARKKLLIPGVRSGGKSMLKDVIEARDTLNRYIALHEPLEEGYVPEVAPIAVAPGTVMEDGWIVHEGPDMPEPLSNEQYVEVRLRSGVEYTGNFAKRAMDWVWAEDNSIQPITHYRLLRFSTGDATVGELDHGKELVGEPGWYQHAGGPRPAGVAQRDRVQVRLSNGHTVAIPREAFKWHWEYRQDSPEAAPHIEAWRFV